MAYYQPQTPMAARPAVITSDLSNVNPSLLKAHLQRDMGRFIHSSRGTHSIPSSVISALAVSATAAHASNQQAILAALTGNSNTAAQGTAPHSISGGNTSGTINNPNANFFSSHVVAATSASTTGTSGGSAGAGSAASGTNSTVFGIPGKATASATASATTYTPAHDVLSNHSLFNYKLSFASVQQEALFRRVHQFLATSCDGGFEDSDRIAADANKVATPDTSLDKDETNVFASSNRVVSAGPKVAKSANVIKYGQGLPVAGKLVLRRGELCAMNRPSEHINSKVINNDDNSGLVASPPETPRNFKDDEDGPNPSSIPNNSSFALSTAAAAKKETVSLLSEAADRLLAYIVVTTPALSSTIDNGHGGFGIAANGYPHVGISTDVLPATVPSTAQMLATITASQPIMRLFRCYPQIATLLADKALWGFYHQLLRDAVTNTIANAGESTAYNKSPTSPPTSGGNQLPSTYSNRVPKPAQPPSAAIKPPVSSPNFNGKGADYYSNTKEGLAAGPAPGTSVALLPASAWLALWLDLRQTLGTLGIHRNQNREEEETSGVSASTSEWLPVHVARVAVREYDAITGTLSYASPSSAASQEGERDIVVAPMFAAHIPAAIQAGDLAQQQPRNSIDANDESAIRSHLSHVYRTIVPQIQLLGAAGTLPSPLSAATLAAAMIAGDAGQAFAGLLSRDDRAPDLEGNVNAVSESDKLNIFFRQLYGDGVGSTKASATAVNDYSFFTSVISPLLAHRKADLCRGHASSKALVTLARVEKDILWRQLAQLTDAIYGDVRAILDEYEEAEKVTGGDDSSAPPSGPPSSIGHGRAVLSAKPASTVAGDGASAAMLPLQALGYLIDAPASLVNKLRQKAADLIDEKERISASNQPSEAPKSDTAPASPTSKQLSSYQYQYHPPKSPLTPQSASSTSGTNLAAANTGKKAPAPIIDPNVTSAVPLRFHEQFHPDTALLVCLWGLEELINVNVLQTATYDHRLVVAAPPPKTAQVSKPAAQRTQPAIGSASSQVPQVTVTPATPVYSDPTSQGDIEASPEASPNKQRLQARAADPSVAPNSALASMAASPERVHVTSETLNSLAVEDDSGEASAAIEDADHEDAMAVASNEDGQPLEAEVAADLTLDQLQEAAPLEADGDDAAGLLTEESEDTATLPRDTLDSLTAIPYEEAAKGEEEATLLSPTIQAAEGGTLTSIDGDGTVSSSAASPQSESQPTQSSQAASPNAAHTALTPPPAHQHLLMPPVSSSLLFPSKTPASVNSLYANIIMSVILLCSSRTRPYVLLDGPTYSHRVHAEAAAAMAARGRSSGTAIPLAPAIRCLAASVAHLGDLSNAHNAATGSIVVGASSRGKLEGKDLSMAFIDMGIPHTAHHRQPEPHNPLKDTSTMLILRDMLATAAPSAASATTDKTATAAASSPNAKSSIPSYLQVSEKGDHPSIYSVVPTLRATPTATPTLPLSFATIQTLLQWQFQALVQHPTPITAASILHVLVREGEAVMNVMVNATPLVNSPDPFTANTSAASTTKRPTGYGNSSYSGGQQGAGPVGPTPASQLIPIGDGIIMWVARTLQIAMASQGSGAFDSDGTYTTVGSTKQAGAPQSAGGPTFYAPVNSWPLYCQLLLAAVRLVNARNAHIRHPWWSGTLKPTSSKVAASGGGNNPSNYVASVAGPAGMHRDAQKALGLIFLSAARMYINGSDDDNDQPEASAPTAVSRSQAFASRHGFASSGALLAAIEKATNSVGPSQPSAPIFASASGPEDDQAKVPHSEGSSSSDDDGDFLRDSDFRPFDNATFFAMPSDAREDVSSHRRPHKSEKAKKDGSRLTIQASTALLQKYRHRSPIASTLRLILRCVEEALRDGANPQLSETIVSSEAEDAAFISAAENKLPSYLDGSMAESNPYRFRGDSDGDNGSSSNLYGSMRVSGIADPEPRRKGFGDASMHVGISSPSTAAGGSETSLPPPPPAAECPEVLRQTLIAAARMGPMVVTSGAINDNPQPSSSASSARFADPSLASASTPFAEMNLFLLIQQRDGSSCVNGDLIETMEAAVGCSPFAAQPLMKGSQSKIVVAPRPTHIPTYNSSSKDQIALVDPAPSTTAALSISVGMDGTGKVTCVSTKDTAAGSSSPNPQRPTGSSADLRKRMSEPNPILFNPALVNVRKTNLNTVLAGVPTLGPCLQSKLPASGEQVPLFDPRDEPGSYDLWQTSNHGVGGHGSDGVVGRYFAHLLSAHASMGDCVDEVAHRSAPLLGASATANLISAHKALGGVTKGLPPHCNPQLLGRYINNTASPQEGTKLKHRVLAPGYGVPPSHTAWAVLQALDTLKSQWPIIHMGARRQAVTTGASDMRHYGEFIAHL